MPLAAKTVMMARQLSCLKVKKPLVRLVGVGCFELCFSWGCSSSFGRLMSQLGPTRPDIFRHRERERDEREMMGSKNREGIVVGRNSRQQISFRETGRKG